MAFLCQSFYDGNTFKNTYTQSHRPPITHLYAYLDEGLNMEQNDVCTEFLYMLQMSLIREIRFSVSISLVIVPYTNEVIIHLMYNRTPIIHIKFQHCNTDDTDVRKTH